MTNNVMASGNINAIHCPKLMPRFSPSGLFSVCKAIAFGGVPIGVAIPPILAAMGIESVKAMRPFPFAGNAAKTGVRKVSIIAAVAVLLTNIEKMPVMSRKPNKTLSLLLPKGLMRFLASKTSKPDLVAAIARINPPRKSIMTGLANVAIISFELSNFPKVLLSSPLKIDMLLSDIVRHIRVMIPNDVAHEGIASVSHDSVANTKTAITRC